MSPIAEGLDAGQCRVCVYTYPSPSRSSSVSFIVASGARRIERERFASGSTTRELAFLKLLSGAESIARPVRVDHGGDEENVDQAGSRSVGGWRGRVTVEWWRLSLPGLLHGRPWLVQEGRKGAGEKAVVSTPKNWSHTGPLGGVEDCRDVGRWSRLSWAGSGAGPASLERWDLAWRWAGGRGGGDVDAECQ